MIGDSRMHRWESGDRITRSTTPRRFGRRWVFVPVAYCLAVAVLAFIGPDPKPNSVTARILCEDAVRAEAGGTDGALFDTITTGDGPWQVTGTMDPDGNSLISVSFACETDGHTVDLTVAND